MSESGKETGFTPGPWSIVRYGDGSSLVIHSDTDNRVCFMATASSDRPTSHAAIRANARLIAAAPALYEACADASFYLKALGARLAALDLDNTETYGCLKTASMFACTLDAALLLSNTGGTENG